MLKTKELECSDCLLELKPGEGVKSLDGSLLCVECKAEEEQNERLSDIEDEDGQGLEGDDLRHPLDAMLESQADEILDSLERN